jgi:isochorismate hydrolase
MVHDALSAVTPQEHEHSLQNWMLFFGDVLGTEEIMRRIQPAR